ncbi:MAG: hypothetical protein M3N24_04400 [Actinomycetota bacterium]|nr:hypothetical protein [Actinomycetota bacterium]
MEVEPVKDRELITTRLVRFREVLRRNRGRFAPTCRRRSLQPKSAETVNSLVVLRSLLPLPTDAIIDLSIVGRADPLSALVVPTTYAAELRLRNRSLDGHRSH